MIYFTEPKKFKPKFEVVSCFFECNGEILLLQRQDHKPEGKTWGIPAGKIDQKETAQAAILRELFEEIGFEASKKEVLYFNKVFVCYPDYDFIYHTFSLKLEEKPIVKINSGEHKNFKWLKPIEALKINLIQDLDSCIKMFYKI